MLTKTADMSIKSIRAIIAALISFASLSLAPGAFAQKVAVSTDVLGYVNMLTLNGELSYSVSRHWSTSAGFRYNPFTYRDSSDDHLVSNRQRSVSAGARYWPWHVFSGWWFSGKAQYQEFNRGGIKSLETREGDRYGAGVALGFTYMLNSWLNMEVSVGTWGGKEIYTVYECPECGVRVDQGEKYFILPNDIMFAFSLVF